MRNWNLPNRSQLHKLHRTPDHIQLDIFPSLLAPRNPIHPDPQQLDIDFERLKEAEAYSREIYPAVQQNNSNLASFLWLCILLDFIMDNSVSSTKGLVLAKVAPAIWPCDARAQDLLVLVLLLLLHWSWQLLKRTLCQLELAIKCGVCHPMGGL